MSAINIRVTQHRVGGSLESELSDHHPFSVVPELFQHRRQVGSMRCLRSFLHLQEQWIILTIADEKNQIRSRPHRPDPHYTMCHVHGRVTTQHKASVARESK